MNSRSRIVADISNLLKFVSFIAFFPLMADQVWAQAPSKAKGEVVSASKTKINGLPAISGMTVFSNNRILTGSQGAAVISLGRLGRIECGADTDMTLRLSDESIGGELRSNRVVVSARAGIAIAINTAKSMVTTDGQQPAVLTIYVDRERARVISHVGAASVVSTGRGRSPGGWKRDVTIATWRGLEARRPGRRRNWRRERRQNWRSGSDRAAPNAPTFAGLFKAGINYSIDPKSDNGPGSEEPFETSMTCRESDKKYCHKKSKYKPKRP